jgi:hypothetical protein
MKTKIVVGIYLLVALMACNKEPNEVKPVAKEPNYFPMTTGSYWIYNTYKIDSLKNEELISENDTTAVIGDTILNGNPYKVFYGKLYGAGGQKYFQFRRDSLGYIVDEYGTVVFSQSNFSDTLYSKVIPNRPDTSYYMYSMMQSATDEIIVPAGVFDSVLNYNLIFIYWTDPNKLTLTMDNLYSPNVGKILKQYAYSGEFQLKKSYYEERLTAYYITK